MNIIEQLESAKESENHLSLIDVRIAEAYNMGIRKAIELIQNNQISDSEFRKWYVNIPEGEGEQWVYISKFAKDRNIIKEEKMEMKLSKEQIDNAVKTLIECEKSRKLTLLEELKEEIKVEEVNELNEDVEIAISSQFFNEGIEKAMSIIDNRLPTKKDIVSYIHKWIRENDSSKWSHEQLTVNLVDHFGLLKKDEKKV